MIQALEIITDDSRIKRFVSAFQNHQRHLNPCSKRFGVLCDNGITLMSFHLQDGKVYGVGRGIAVYDHSEFRRALLNGEFPGFKFVQDMNVTTKRLVFSLDELDRKGAGCNENDTLIIGGNYQVLVKRNGEVTDRRTDGSVVPPEQMEYLNGIEEYRSVDGREVVDQWRTTRVYEDGSISEILLEGTPVMQNYKIVIEVTTPGDMSEEEAKEVVKDMIVTGRRRYITASNDPVAQRYLQVTPSCLGDNPTSTELTKKMR